MDRAEAWRSRKRRRKCSGAGRGAVTVVRCVPVLQRYPSVKDLVYLQHVSPDELLAVQSL